MSYQTHPTYPNAPTTASPTRENACHSAASALHDAGYTVIPRVIDGKKPRVKWKKYQSGERRSPAPCPEHGPWQGANAGCILLGRSSQLVVIDCDTPDAVAYAWEHLPPTPLVVSTSRGAHFYFRRPSDAVIAGYGHGTHRDGSPKLKTRTKFHVPGDKASIAIDLKADVSYVVMPGSVHNERPIVYAVQLKRDGESDGDAFVRLAPTVPTLDATWLDRFCSCDKKECDHSRIGYTSSCKHTNASSRWRPAVGGGDRAFSASDALRRAEAYVGACDGAPEGQRANTLFKLAATVTRGFDVAIGDAARLLLGWAARCDPPLPDAEVDSAVESAYQNGTEPIGGRLAQDRADVELKPAAPAYARAIKQTIDTKPFGLRFDQRKSLLESDAFKAFEKKHGVAAANVIRRLLGCCLIETREKCASDAGHDSPNGKAQRCGKKHCPGCSALSAKAAENGILDGVPIPSVGDDGKITFKRVTWPDRVALLEVTAGGGAVPHKRGTIEYKRWIRAMFDRVVGKVGVSQIGVAKVHRLEGAVFVVTGASLESLQRVAAHMATVDGVDALARVVDKEEAAKAIGAARRSYAAYAAKLLRMGLYADLIEFVMRTNAQGQDLTHTALGRQRTPVPSDAGMRAYEMHELRMDPTYEAPDGRCHHVHADGERCGAPLRVAFVSAQTGETLGERPHPGLEGLWQLRDHAAWLATMHGTRGDTAVPHPT